MAILARPLIPVDELLKKWQSSIERGGFQASQSLITSSETAQHALLAVKVRLSILLRTYGGEYHSDSFDFGRLVSAVESGLENIIFWGDVEDASVLRHWLVEGACPEPEEIDKLQLGTATIIDAGEIFGANHFEMCRTGSVCRTVGAVHALLTDLKDWFQREEKKVTFLSVPRNRTSTPSIVGGAAVHRLHVREIESRFWGVAPWYVMQGNELEILDYRELYSEPEDLISALEATKQLFFACEDDAQFVEELIRLNCPGHQIPTMKVLHETGRDRWRWRVMPCESKQLQEFNPLHIILANDGEFPGIVNAIESAELNAPACIVVHVKIDSPDSIPAQIELCRQGFYLTCIVPGKSTAAQESCQFYGLWAKPRSDLPLAEPYYLQFSGHSETEARVLEHLRRLRASLSP